MGPKNAGPRGGYWSLPSRSHRVPGVWLKVSRRRGCLGVGSGVPSRLLQRKQRSWALYLSNRPVPPANCSGRAAFTRSEGSHPHKGACASAPRDGPPSIATGQPEGRPPPRRFHPDTVLSSAPEPSLRREAIPAPRFKDRGPWACHRHPRRQAPS